MQIPANVYIWDNGMVMAFDDRGEQIPALQGPVGEVFEALKAAATDSTLLNDSPWTEERAQMLRERYSQLALNWRSSSAGQRLRGER